MSAIPRFAGIPTFFSSNIWDGKTDAEIGIIGVPFDIGTTFRSGARFGPNAIRTMSKMIQLQYHPHYDKSLHLEDIRDCGDLPCGPHNCEKALQTLVSIIPPLLRHIRFPIFVGGDHSICYPIVKCLSEKYASEGSLSIIHFDAHLDTLDSYFDNEKYNHGTFLRRLVDERCINPKTSVHIGTRGTIYAKELLEEDKNMGFKIFTVEDMERESSVNDVCSVVGPNVYLTIDIDCLDPSTAPGTGTPACGGFTSRELFKILRGFSGKINVVGCDIVEVSPPYDTSDITALVASEIIQEIIFLTRK